MECPVAGAMPQGFVALRPSGEPEPIALTALELRATFTVSSAEYNVFASSKNPRCNSSTLICFGTMLMSNNVHNSQALSE
jgi:hypothetical protein